MPRQTQRVACAQRSLVSAISGGRLTHAAVLFSLRTMARGGCVVWGAGSVGSRTAGKHAQRTRLCEPERRDRRPVRRQGRCGVPASAQRGVVVVENAVWQQQQESNRAVAVAVRTDSRGETGRSGASARGGRTARIQSRAAARMFAVHQNRDEATLPNAR